MEQYLKYPEIIGKEDGIYEELYNPKTKKTTIERICNRTSIDCLLENKDNGKFFVQLNFDALTKEIKKCVVPLEDTRDSKQIVKLSRYGVDVESSTSSVVFKHLQNELENAPRIMYETSKVGFVNSNHNIFYAGIFLGYDDNQNVIKRTDYQYSGNINLQSKSKLNDYKKNVNNEVIGNYALEMALAIGFTAPLIPYLKSVTQMPTLLIHTSGQSTTGKSTAARVVASVFGSSNSTIIRPQTIFNSWNTTSNGIESILANNFGIPVIFDELGKKKLQRGETLDDILYSVTEGIGKSRSAVDGKGLPIQQWETLIFSNGERTLFENTSNAVGLRMRILDLRDIAYTVSAEHAERIGQSFNDCCGIAGKHFIKKLFMDDKDTIIATFKKIRDEIANQLKGINNGQRIAKMPALILLAVDLLNKYNIFTLNRKEISDLLVNNILLNTGEQVDMAEKAYNIIMEIVAQNTNKFVHNFKELMYKESSSVPYGEHWGYINYNELKEITEIVFISNILKQQLLIHGFDNITTVMSELKQRGYLDCERGKTYRRRTINSVTTQCHIIKPKKIK